MKQRQVSEADQHVGMGATSSRMFAMAVVLGAVVCTQKLPGAEGGNLWLPPTQVPNSSDQFHHMSDGAGGAIVASVDGSPSGPVYVSRMSNTGSILWGPVLLSGTGFSGKLPRLCSDGTGGAIVAWAQDVSGGRSIYVQRVNSSGILQWPSPVCASNTNDLRSLEVAAGSQGMFLVYHVYAGYSVRAAHVSAAGVVASPGLIGLPLGTSSVDRGEPRLVPDGSGGNGVIVAWQDSADYSLKAQKVVLSGGSTLNQSWGGGFPIVICSITGGGAYHPAVAQDGSGGALISWTELYPLGGTAEIRVQKVDSSGVAQWTANGVVLVDSAGVPGNTNWWSPSTSSAVARDASGGAYVAWDDWRNVDATNSMDVYAQRVDSSAVPQWTSGGIRLGDYMVGSQGAPVMISDLQGGALVTFEDAAAWSVDISLVKLNSAGKEWFRFVFSDSASSGDPGYDQHNPAVIYDASGATPKGCIVAWGEQTWAAYMQKVEMGESTGAVTLLSCSGTPGGDGYDRGFYVPQYPGVSLNSARLELSAADAGSYVLTLTVRSNTYDGPVLGASTTTVSLNGSTSENQPVTFTFLSTPIAKYSRVCFILSLVSGPGTAVYYAVPVSGGCTEVVQTQDTTPPLSTWRRDGVNLVLTGSSIPPETLLSCSGELGADGYDRGFYVPQYPGVSLNSAQLKLSAANAGSYVLALTVRSNTYDGPVLTATTNTVTLNGSTSEHQPVVFTFPSTPIAKYSRVCFILSWISGPSSYVYYAVPVSGGCTTVVQTHGTNPPLDAWRRNGVDLVLRGVNNPSSDLSSAIAQQLAGLYLYWKSIAGRTYTVQTNDNLQLFNALQTGITATPPTNTFGPIVPSPVARQFYRVVLEPTPVP